MRRSLSDYPAPTRTSGLPWPGGRIIATGRARAMVRLTRRHAMSVFGAGAVAAAASRPRRAKAGTTITAWWSQGYYKAEDDALRAAVAAYEKQSGNTVALSLV